MRILLVLTLIVVPVTCGSSDATPKSDPCSAAGLGLGSAKALTAWKAPASCTAKSGESPAWITSDADAKEHFDCKDNGKLGLDWKTKSLVRTTSSWSPATVGISAFDDGKKITLVSRQRSPCKGDPQPMPTPAITSLFVGGTGKRAFGQAACTIETKCP